MVIILFHCIIIESLKIPKYDLIPDKPKLRCLSQSFLTTTFSHFSPSLPSLTSAVIIVSMMVSSSKGATSFSKVSSVISVKYLPFRSPSNSPYLKEA